MQTTLCLSFAFQKLFIIVARNMTFVSYTMETELHYEKRMLAAHITEQQI